VDGGSIADCGHFVPEERPDEIARYTLAMVK
jgi:pimeloyl-ACP methyl ester carboxylesterase